MLPQPLRNVEEGRASPILIEKAKHTHTHKKEPGAQRFGKCKKGLHPSMTSAGRDCTRQLCQSDGHESPLIVSFLGFCPETKIRAPIHHCAPRRMPSCPCSLSSPTSLTQMQLGFLETWIRNRRGVGTWGTVCCTATRTSCYPHQPQPTAPTSTAPTTM